MPTLTCIDCTCSDGSSRCVHVLAVFYDVARRIDEDPQRALDVLTPFDGPNESAAIPQRWTTLDDLDPADYFTVR